MRAAYARGADLIWLVVLALRIYQLPGTAAPPPDHGMRS